VAAFLLQLAGSAALFAQEGNPPAGDPSALLPSLLPILGVVLLFYFILIRPQRREQAKRMEMLAGVKKNDRVITNAGIYGVVSNVNRDADEVTLKVDEATNTKLRVTLGSIGRVLGEEPSNPS